VKQVPLGRTKNTTKTSCIAGEIERQHCNVSVNDQVIVQGRTDKNSVQELELNCK